MDISKNKRKLTTLKWDQIIGLSNDISVIIANGLKSRPYHLNVIETACSGRFKEIGHSLVLANMLKHSDIQSSFIKNFMPMEFMPMEFMEVTAEKDRVDVALKGSKFVIIENKINGAVEQPSQVYRYVHEIGMLKYNFEMGNIFVIYLNPFDYSLPSYYTLCDEDGKNNVFDEFDKIEGKHYEVKTYKYDITKWLRNLKEEYLKKEYLKEEDKEKDSHILSALDQYIDFLENKFHTSKEDKDMNEKINQKLLSCLEIDEKNDSYEEKMEILVEQSEKIIDLQNAISNYKEKLIEDSMEKWFKNIEKEIKNTEYIDKEKTTFGVNIATEKEKKIWLAICNGKGKDNNDIPYLGFKSELFKDDPNNKEYKKYITAIISTDKNLHINPNSNDWLAWVDKVDCGVVFKKIYHTLVEKEIIKE